MANLTYLLGAGASFNSIPVVESLSKRMALYMQAILGFSSDLIKQDDGSPYDDKILSFYGNLDRQKISEYQPVLNEALKHRTIDTYARKLFLRNKPIDRKKLALLKEFVCLYFAFEQSDSSSKLPGRRTSSGGVIDNFGELRNDYEEILDYRYDVFFATLLNTNLELPDTLSIISWNYDHQIELAYADYAQCGLEDARDRLSIFPRKIGDSARIVKLNGSASQIVFGAKHGREEALYSLEDYKSPIGSNYQEAINEFCTSNIEGRQKPESDRTGLTFAWEGDDIQLQAIQKAKNIISQTDELVVIGYSFPNFNRRIDLEIFEDIGIIPVSVQCVDKDYPAAKENLLSLNERIIDSEISYKNDLSQFYIPKSYLT